MRLFKRKPPERCHHLVLCVSTLADDREEATVASIYCAREKLHVGPCEITAGVSIDISDEAVLYRSRGHISTGARLTL